MSTVRSARRPRCHLLPFLKRTPTVAAAAASTTTTTATKSELTIPIPFRCPISLDLMKDPVTLSTGIIYDRQSIETWLESGKRTCPVTKQALTGDDDDLVPNHSLRRMIQDWCVANRSFGVERIPTPRIPATPAQVAELLSEVALAARRGDAARCRELARKVKSLGKESERNRRCIVSGGAARVLSASFADLASESSESSKTEAMEEILSALVAFFPLGEDARRHISSAKSMQAIVGVLKSGSLAARLSAVLVLKELVSSLTADRVHLVAKTDDLTEALAKLIEKPVSPQSTKASLVTSYYLALASQTTAARFVEAGLVSTVLDVLVDAEKSTSEKALAALDALLSCERGREVASGHALAVPVLVKKLFRVSDMATEFAVSALWKLCKHGEAPLAGGCLVEALQVGAFHKLLLLLQVGCEGTTKEKATDLLKLLNAYRANSECIESGDLKGIKRPF